MYSIEVINAMNEKACEKVEEKKIYTHDETSRIIDCFEEILDRYDIKVPSPEDDEREEDNTAKLYGSVYGDLMDNIENMLIDMLGKVKKGYSVVPYEYSGRY
jgi:phage gp29-like protein